MAFRLTVAVLILTALSACSGARAAGSGPRQGLPVLHIPRAAHPSPVEWNGKAFTQALQKELRKQGRPANPEIFARTLLEVPPRSGWYGYTPGQGVIDLSGPPTASHWGDLNVRMTQEYLRWCETLGKPGDCRAVLMNAPVLAGDGRYALAMSFALDAVIPEMMEAFQGMADPEVLKASLLWTMTLYAALWLVPEPVFSKGLVATVTAGLVCYVGVDTFWTLIQGWRRLVETADQATRLSELQAAGKQYGHVMGKNAARAFALLLTAALGQTASGFAAKVPMLPGSAQAAASGMAQGGIRLTALAQVETVTATAEGMTLVLAPNAMASMAQSGSGAASPPVDAAGPEHHIATDKWLHATHGGGPWTPRFKELFARADMSLNDPANRVRVSGHKGPHPEEYHQEVFDRLSEAMQGCRNAQQCRAALTDALHRLRRLISKPESRLNTLVTQGTPR